MSGEIVTTTTAPLEGEIIQTFSPQDRLNELRAKAVSGELLTVEETREAIDILRADRETAKATKKKTTSKRKKKVEISSEAQTNINNLFGL